MNTDSPQPPVILTPTGHYGAFASPKDDRDHALGAYAAINPATLPKSFYPNIDELPVLMQSKLGACVGHAAALSQMAAELQETGGVMHLSPRFLYALAKCQDGFAGEGTYPRLVASIMKNTGCATEATCPNDTTLDHEAYVYHRDAANIPVLAMEEARKIKISNYAFAGVNDAELKTAIKFAGENRGGVFMLMDIDKNLWQAPDGRVSWDYSDLMTNGMRVPNDPATTGGHETYPYAFDEAGGRTVIIGRNSWSEAWAKANPGERRYGKDGDYWFFLDEWIPHIREIVTTVDLDDNYVAPAWTYTFTRALQVGMSGSDVVALQHALKIDGEFTYPTLTGYFGQVTLQAVKAFQEKYRAEILAPLGIPNPTGYVGPSTIRKLNALFAPK